MQRAFDMAFKAAESDATILVLGESGTGKSMLARAIHQRSLRAQGAFVTVSCPSLSRELLESELFGHAKGAFTGAHAETLGKVAAADGGTLFLDEIGELPIEIQAKLLRLLQEREYERVGETKSHRSNVRVIAATNRNLQEAVAAGKFREDLFYRLNVISVSLPPLRERTADIEHLVSEQLKFFAVHAVGKKAKTVSPAALEHMRRYHWPGNVRELRNVIERAVILSSGEQIEPADLGETMQSPSEIRIGGKVSLADLEQEHIRRVRGKPQKRSTRPRKSSASIPPRSTGSGRSCRVNLPPVSDDQARRNPRRPGAYRAIRRASWPVTFERERMILEPVLATWLAGSVEHIGSTAVLGLAAKPVDRHHGCGGKSRRLPSRNFRAGADWVRLLLIPARN